MMERNSITYVVDREKHSNDLELDDDFDIELVSVPSLNALELSLTLYNALNFVDSNKGYCWRPEELKASIEDQYGVIVSLSLVSRVLKVLYKLGLVDKKGGCFIGVPNPIAVTDAFVEVLNKELAHWLF